jgi:hypothetical protein
MGYAPLFSNLTTGTLCGRWPDIGLWPIILSMSDRSGVVDVTPAFIAGVTGLSIEEVVSCMARFCAPDPGSRSDAQNGARLVLLDDHRDWGWRIVNHEHYRERARLASKAAREVAEGLNRKRMADRRPPPTAADRRRPPPTPSPNYKLQTTNTGKRGAPRPVFDPVVIEGLDLVAWERWVAYRIELKKPLKPLSLEAAARAMAALGDQQAAAVQHSIANQYQGLIQPRGGRSAPKQRAKTVAELEAEEAARATR